MKRVIRFWKIIVIDILGVAFMLGGLATGWLPGPGGIPLFIIGLSLLAINHTWAERYIEILKRYADRLGDLIFVSNPKIQIAYDLISAALFGSGSFLLYHHSAKWTTSFGVSLTVLGITLFLGNRNRWLKVKAIFKHKR
jgi:hypothetical protein